MVNKRFLRQQELDAAEAKKAEKSAEPVARKLFGKKDSDKK